jgi:hypothetical protein
MQSKPRSGCAIVAIPRLQLQATSARALHGAGGIRRTSGFPRALAAARAALVRSEIATPVLGNRRQDVDGQLIGVRVDHVVAQLKERGDPWRLNEEAKPCAHDVRRPPLGYPQSVINSSKFTAYSPSLSGRCG